MRHRRWDVGRGVVLLTLALAACDTGTRPGVPGPLTAELETALATSKYVYVATLRKNGSFGAPAEIWFMHHQGAVWVASPVTTWRVRRIRAGRPKARIAAGRPDGPSFLATGSIVADEALYDLLFRTFASKYPDGWPKYEQRFREDLPAGKRVLIKYEPIG